MRIGLFVALALFCATSFSPRPARADEAALTAQLQQILDAYVKDRASIEGLSGAALQVDRGEGHPILAIYAGDNGLSDKKPIGPDTLFDIGSNTKEFTAALILKLEAAGKLNIDDTIGRWLPQYPAWKDVTIRSLLQMTSPIPNYSETVAIGEIEVADLHHQFSAKDLMGFVDPENGNHFPPATGWFYSNTNYILAGLIIAAIRHELRAGADDDDPGAARAAQHVLRGWAASGTRGGGASDGACSARPLHAAGLPRIPAGAMQGVNARAAHRQRHADAEPLMGRGGGGHRLEPARSWSMDSRSFREARCSRKTTRRVTTLVSNTTGLPLPEVTSSLTVS
jgi:Beta-lactamase